MWAASDPVPRDDVPLLDYPLLLSMLRDRNKDSIVDAVLKVAFVFTACWSMSDDN